MSEHGHPLNTIARTIWRSSGHSIESFATCVTLGGVTMSTAQAHGVFHSPSADDYHELSLLEFKAAMRGLIGWERVTTEVSKNRYSLGFVAAVWEAYDLAHEAWCGVEVDWHLFRDGVLHPAIDEQQNHWAKRGVDWRERGPTPGHRGNFTGARRVPLTAEALMVEQN